MGDTSTLKGCLRAAKEAIDKGEYKAALAACKVRPGQTRWHRLPPGPPGSSCVVGVPLRERLRSSSSECDLPSARLRTSRTATGPGGA